MGDNHGILRDFRGFFFGFYRMLIELNGVL
jgi:hypothetical protein